MSLIFDNKINDEIEDNEYEEIDENELQDKIEIMFNFIGNGYELDELKDFISYLNSDELNMLLDLSIKSNNILALNDLLFYKNLDNDINYSELLLTSSIEKNETILNFFLNCCSEKLIENINDTKKRENILYTFKNILFINNRIAYKIFNNFLNENDFEKLELNEQEYFKQIYKKYRSKKVILK